MDGGVQWQPAAVDGIPAENLRIEPVGVAQAVVSLVGGRVSRAGFPFLADQAARQDLGPVGVVYGPLGPAGPGFADSSRQLRRGMGAGGLDRPDVAKSFPSGPCRGGKLRRLLTGQPPQKIGRDDGTEWNVHGVPPQLGGTSL